MHHGGIYEEEIAGKAYDTRILARFARSAMTCFRLSRAPRVAVRAGSPSGHPLGVPQARVAQARRERAGNRGAADDFSRPAERLASEAPELAPAGNRGL